MGFDLGSLLQQYIGGAAPAPTQAQAHFDQVSQNASPDLISTGLAAMFRSDATPAFGQMAGQLFGQANPNQQAGMLNQLIAGMGPAVLASLVNKSGSGGGALGGLGGLLGQFTGSGPTTPAVTPDQASQLTPAQVQVIASHAEQANPGIIDQMSSFYAQHPGLVKTVGGAALSIALAKMAERA
jgi:hypothetical protein